MGRNIMRVGSNIMLVDYQIDWPITNHKEYYIISEITVSYKGSWYPIFEIPSFM